MALFWSTIVTAGVGLTLVLLFGASVAARADVGSARGFHLSAHWLVHFLTRLFAAAMRYDSVSAGVLHRRNSSRGRVNSIRHWLSDDGVPSSVWRVDGNILPNMDFSGTYSMAAFRVSSHGV